MPRRAPRPACCICINCKWVDRCKAYHFVETKHEQPHLTPTPDFMPREGSPKITVAIRREDEDDARIAWNAIRESLWVSGEHHTAAGESPNGLPRPSSEEGPTSGASGGEAAASTAAAGEGDRGGVRGQEEEGGEDYDHSRHLEMAALAIPKFTTEYDVVACADYVVDNGRWVRLMPEEIRQLNPDFVPS